MLKAADFEPFLLSADYTIWHHQSQLFQISKVEAEKVAAGILTPIGIGKESLTTEVINH